MKLHGPPDQWQFPSWHPDWDGDFKHQSLREFAKALLSSTTLAVECDVFEEGYAKLDVFRDTLKIGEVYVNRDSDDHLLPKYSVYAGDPEDELHTTDLLASMALLMSCHSRFRTT